MKAIISGGGTGGHIYPALAVAKALKEKGWDILYIGSKGGLESDVVPREDINYREINVAPLIRKISPKLITATFKTSIGLLESFKIIKSYKADIVLGTGGFVAGPVVLAASLMNIPTIIHEQNVYPGFTNKLLAKRVNFIALNFEDAKKYFPKNTKAEYLLTGNPIRSIILETERKEGIKKMNLSTEKKTILVFGGSQGAMSINNAILDVYKNYLNKNKRSIPQIIHITGKKNYKQVLEKIKSEGININKLDNYKIMPYLSEMEYAYAVADLIVSRAGATGLAEITAKGIPAILVPYPHAAENHQEHNARTLEKNKAAKVLLDSDLNGETLFREIDNLINDDTKLNIMSENSKKLGKINARDMIVEAIEKLM
ncbi:undecaprenyldiphospho-muramoylpentapeptide beta-N-acetylglucosaminyltransferase [Natronospora cellulosivora (SeqCode)]